MSDETITITTTRSYTREVTQAELTALALRLIPENLRSHSTVAFTNSGEAVITYEEEFVVEEPIIPAVRTVKPTPQAAEDKPKRAYTKRAKSADAPISSAVQKARGGFKSRYISQSEKRNGGGEK